MGLPRTQPEIIGTIGLCCALLGLLSWIGYGTFATKGIYAVISHRSENAGRMASYAAGFSIAQLLLGVSSVGLGWRSKVKRSDSGLARTLGVLDICLGMLVLALLLLLV